MSKETLHIQIKSFLIDEFPNLKEIKDVTDHAAGANPYYRSDDETWLGYNMDRFCKKYFKELEQCPQAGQNSSDSKNKKV